MPSLFLMPEGLQQSFHPNKTAPHKFQEVKFYSKISSQKAVTACAFLP